MASDRMSRERLAADLMQDVQGFEGRPRHAPKERSMRNSNTHDYDASMEGLFDADSPLTMGNDLFPVEVTVAAGAALDLSLFSDAHEDLSALPTGMTSPNLAKYKSMVRYIKTNPVVLTQIQIISSEPANGGPVINTLKLIQVKETPLASLLSNERPISALKSSQDYQANVFNIPFKYTLDTWNHLRFMSAVNPASNPAVTLTFNFSIGARVDLKRLLAPVMNSVSPTTNRAGQRGSTPVK